MKNQHWLTYSITLTMALISMNCIAVNWQDRLTNPSEALAYHCITTGTQSGGLSLSSLTDMLDGGNTALSANTMANAAGVIEYCAKNKLSSMTSADNIQSQLIHKLSLKHPRNSTVKHDYAQGQQGLLNTRNGQQLDMSDLSHSELAAKVKAKACDLVLRQGMDYLTQ